MSKSRIPRVADSDDLFTVVEASCLLGVSRASIRAAVVRGELEPVYTLDGCRRLSRRSVLGLRDRSSR